MDIPPIMIIALVVFSSTISAIVVHYWHSKGGEYKESDRFSPEQYSTSGASALPAVVNEAQRSLDQALQTHSEQSKKATQMAQINGLILTILVGIAADFDVDGMSKYLVFGGGGFFTISTIIAVLGTRGHTMTIGVNPTDFDKVFRHNLNDDQYRLWILNRGYRKWIEDGKAKVAKKRTLVKWSILTFLFGAILVAVGFFLMFNGF